MNEVIFPIDSDSMAWEQKPRRFPWDNDQWISRTMRCFGGALARAISKEMFPNVTASLDEPLCAQYRHTASASVSASKSPTIGSCIIARWKCGDPERVSVKISVDAPLQRQAGVCAAGALLIISIIYFVPWWWSICTNHGPMRSAEWVGTLMGITMGCTAAVYIGYWPTWLLMKLFIKKTESRDLGHEILSKMESSIPQLWADAVKQSKEGTEKGSTPTTNADPSNGQASSTTTPPSPPSSLADSSTTARPSPSKAKATVGNKEKNIRKCAWIIALLLVLIGITAGYGYNKIIYDISRIAAEKGYSVAQYNLGFMYAEGLGVVQDDAEAVKWYRKAAERVIAVAQYNMGVMYQMGRGVAQDDAEAVKWYRKAAEKGFAVAQNNLGVMYQMGRGVAQDDAEAVKWYRKAAEQGNANAQYNLGVMYDMGCGVARDDAEAMKWYLKAAEQENADAQYNLGYMYAEGRGVAQDDAEAMKRYLKASEQGDAEAAQALQELLVR